MRVLTCTPPELESSPDQVDAVTRPRSVGRSEAVAGPAVVYEQEFAFVWRNLRRLGVSEGNLDDAVQDVFMIVHRRWDQFEGRSSVRTWVYGIVARVAKDHRRSARRRRNWFSDVPAGDEPGLAAAIGDDPQAQVERREATKLLHELLGELDDDRRAIFVAVELEQVSVSDAARTLGWNLNTAHARLRSARRRFEAALSRRRSRDSWRLP